MEEIELKLPNCRAEQYQEYAHNSCQFSNRLRVMHLGCLKRIKNSVIPKPLRPACWNEWHSWRTKDASTVVCFTPQQDHFLNLWAMPRTGSQRCGGAARRVFKASVKLREWLQRFASFSSFLCCVPLAPQAPKQSEVGWKCKISEASYWILKEKQTPKGQVYTISQPSKQKLYIETEVSSFAWNSCHYDSYL